MATLTTLKQTLPSQSTHRHVSFSSFLTTADDTFLRKLAESSRHLSPHVQPKKEDDTGEIGVFSAEKYFNGVVEVDHSPRVPKLNIPHHHYTQPKQQTDLLPPPPKPNIVQQSSTTPSVRSESSWNSQIALLQQNRPTKPNKSARRTRKSFLSNLGCNCMCTDSDSIDVEDQHLGELSLNKAVESLETQRKSLEVFGSPLEISKTKSFRKETRPSSIPSTTDFDSDESSSDLFEIESVTGKVNPNLARQGSDAMSTCYAPSEASIEWSVVTASAADFSVMSDYEETVRPAGETQRRRSSISLGCNSSKAVRVADRIGNDKLVADQKLHRISGSYVHDKRLNLENKLMGLEYDSMPRQRAFSALSVPRSQPSQLFFIR